VPPPAPPGSEWHSLFFNPRGNENTLRVSLFILPLPGMMPPCDLHSAGRNQAARRKQMSNEKMPPLAKRGGAR